MKHINSIAALLHALKELSTTLLTTDKNASLIVAKSISCIEFQQTDNLTLTGVFMAADNLLTTVLDNIPEQIKAELNADTEISEAFEELFSKVMSTKMTWAKLVNEDAFMKSPPTNTAH